MNYEHALSRVRNATDEAQPSPLTSFFPLPATCQSIFGDGSVVIDDDSVPLRDVTFVDDEALIIFADSPDLILHKLHSLVVIVYETFSSFLMNINFLDNFFVLQGISYRSVAKKSALRGRSIHNFIEL